MTRQLKIAVADDERDTREFFQEYLTHLGHDVRAAEDGRQLVELCRAFRPDLIVADYAMPGLDGLAAVAEVNRDRPVPVILITGRCDAEQLAQSDSKVYFTRLTLGQHQRSGSCGSTASPSRPCASCRAPPSNDQSPR
jgi:CheY-like chemotaxis protein